MYNNIGFEIRDGKKHVVAKSRIYSPVVFLLTTFGLGLTILKKFGPGRIPKSYERTTKRLLACSPFVKAVQVRISHMNLDFEQIPHRKLESLFFMTGVAGEPDMSRFQKLRVVASPYKEINKLRGLGALPNLQLVSCRNPGVRWLSSLPESLEEIYHDGPLPKTWDLSKYPKLRIVGVFTAKEFDARLMPSSNSVKILDLREIGELSNLPLLKQVLPNLEALYVDEMNRVDYELLVSKLPTVKVIVDEIAS
jgi:hypothetical protein